MTELTRADAARAVIAFDAIAAAATERSSEYRGWMQTLAEKEFNAQGVAPGGKIPGIGSFSLPISADAVYPKNDLELLAWVKETHPSEVVVSEAIRPAFLKKLIKDSDIVGDSVAYEGEIVPGLAVRKGGQLKSVSIRPDAAVKAEALELARAWIGSAAPELPAGEQ